MAPRWAQPVNVGDESAGVKVNVTLHPGRGAARASPGRPGRWAYRERFNGDLSWMAEQFAPAGAAPPQTVVPRVIKGGERSHLEDLGPQDGARPVIVALRRARSDQGFARQGAWLIHPARAGRVTLRPGPPDHAGWHCPHGWELISPDGGRHALAGTLLDRPAVHQALGTARNLTTAPSGDRLGRVPGVLAAARRARRARRAAAAAAGRLWRRARGVPDPGAAGRGGAGGARGARGVCGAGGRVPAGSGGGTGVADVSGGLRRGCIRGITR
jgi:hypothetical protein